MSSGAPQRAKISATTARTWFPVVRLSSAQQTITRHG